MASRTSGSGFRKKRKVSASDSQSSTSNPFSDDEEVSPAANRRSAPAALSVEDSVANFFANQVESEDTKERKLVIEEKKAETAERQAVTRDAESKAILSMLADKTDSTDDKQKKLHTADKEADARLHESKAKVVDANTRAGELAAKNARKAAESKARVEESNANKAFMLKMAEMMGQLSQKL